MTYDLMTVSQTAQYLQLSEKTVRRLIGSGTLNASKIGNKSWRIRLIDVEKYISERSNVNMNKNNMINNIKISDKINVNEPNVNKSKPKLISLFSGCGGMDLGFKQAGFEIVWANDFDADAQSIHKLNLGDIDSRNILSVSEDEIPDGDILTAGFPLSTFFKCRESQGRS